jgi:hypothetical protein
LANTNDGRLRSEQDNKPEKFGELSSSREESNMRQMSIVLVTAIITATVAVDGVLAVNPNTMRLVVRAFAPLDVLQMMKVAEDLPEQTYQAF